MVQSDDLRRAFLESGGTAGGTDDASLGRELEARVSGGRAAWPALGLDDLTFVRHLATHAREALPPASHSADLWIACACAHTAAGAAAAFERAYRPVIERAVARIDSASIDEATQSVLVSLLVAEPGQRPRLAQYAGRAALKTWLATVAANATLRLHRGRDERPHDSLSGLAAQVVMVEPELALAKARHGADLAAALRDALASLESRQRVLLRVKHVQGWRLEQLATMYQVSRATAARMVVGAQEALVAEAKRLLRERLKLTASELESLVNLLQSELEVSIVRILDAESP